MSCAEISTAIRCSAAIRASSATTSCALRRSRLASGSSSSSSRGRLISACAIRIRCCSPPDSRPTRASAKRARRPRRASPRPAPAARGKAAGSRAADRRGRGRPGPGPQRHVRVEQELLRHVADVTPRPRRAADPHASRRVGACRPRITRNSVVLPAPLEPISPVNSPGPIAKLTSSSTVRPPSRTLTPSTLSTSSGPVSAGRSDHSFWVETWSVTARCSASTSASIHDW